MVSDTSSAMQSGDFVSLVEILLGDLVGELHLRLGLKVFAGMRVGELNSEEIERWFVMSVDWKRRLMMLWSSDA